MHRAAALLALLLAACSSGQPSPAATPPPELVVLATSGGGHVVISSRDATPLTNLPPGFLQVSLSGGGDIAEAYDVTPSASGGGTAIDALVPSKGYAVSEVASQPGEAVAALLAPAPTLTTFVGRQTVLAVLTADGTLTGYQHGTRLWATDLGVPLPELRLVGSRVLAGFGGEWRSVDLVTGALGADVDHGFCLPGPVAAAGANLYLDCSGVLGPGGAKVPVELPMVFAEGKAQVLAFPGGEVWRLTAGRATRSGKGPAWMVPPVASPDGGTLYLATSGGVETLSTASASHHRLAGLGGIVSLDETRDGNFVYALAGGRLHLFNSSTGAPAGSLAVNGTAIEVVAGG